jgi:hypothetical protein
MYAAYDDEGILETTSAAIGTAIAKAKGEQ